MLNYSRFTKLTEASARPVLTHLTHIEDLVLTKFEPGAKEALDFLINLTKQFGSNAKSSLSLSVKIDGSPSLVAGLDPKDKRFFIGTKGVFSKTPTIAKSHEDIDRIYSGRAGLLDIMHTAFDELQKIPWPNILQGDVLFTASTKTATSINGEKSIMFKPNTIVYTVPVATELGQRVAAARFGISFHTTYAKAASLETMAASSGAKLPASVPSSLLLLSPSFQDMSGAVTLTAGDTKVMQGLVLDLQKKTSQIKGNEFLKLLKATPVLQAYLMQFQNALVRQGKNLTLTPQTFAIQFQAFLNTVLDAEKAKRKTTKGQSTVLTAFGSLLSAVTVYQVELAEILAWQNAAIAAKQYLMSKLTQSTTMSTFYNTSDGLIAGSHEGFVAADKRGNMIKLVDRGEFSRRNFLQNN